MKIGIIKEGKTPTDNRVPFTPKQCAHIRKLFPEIEIVVEPSEVRCFSDDDYKTLGIPLQKDLRDCDLLMGVKEVPKDDLIPNKTYFFFSHTIKEQPYNKSLMQSLIAKNITMIDYETLTHADGTRILGFGFFAGVVGAHNGLLTYGKKAKQYDLKPAYKCHDMAEMLEQYKAVSLPSFKIILTGSGRVASGFLHVMQELEIKNVEPKDFLNHPFDYPVYTQLKGASLYQNKTTGSYERQEFHEHPERYFCRFQPYAKAGDILMNGIFLDEKMAKLFSIQDVQNSEFQLSVIADVTCDINGSVPLTTKATTIAEPVYGVDRQTLKMTKPYQNTSEIVDMMTVDNLPNELPRDASKYFGDHLIKFILPELLKAQSDVLNRATICKNGVLTEHFRYLERYAADNSVLS